MSRDLAERPPRGVVLAVTAASLPMFMAALDSLVMTFALPIIKQDLDATVEQLQWFVNSYSVVFTAFMLPVAALGDRIGRRRVFLAGVALFTLASMGAALSTSSDMLIAMRALQGLGAAGIVPLSLALVSASTTPKVRPIAIGVWGGVNGLGIAAGPIIGGAVVEGFTWPGIFWLNVPIGVVTIALVALALRESKGTGLGFDGAGSVLGIVFTLPLIWAVVEGEERGWSAPEIIGAFAVSGAGLAAFIWHEHRSPRAFLPLRFFRERAFALANVGGLLFSAGVFGAIFLLSQFLQVSMGYGALEAGLRAAPWTLAPMVVAPLSGFIVQRFGVKPVLITGLALQAGAILVIASLVEAQTEYGTVVVPMVVAGVGMGLTLAPLANAVLVGRRDSEHGIASSVNSTLRQLGMAVGIALATAIFVGNGDYLPGQPFVDGMRPALITCGIITGVGAIAMFALPRTARSAAAPTPSSTGGDAVADPARPARAGATV
ncbi:DHA2 family efflux MFS transporter permease subunit [Clavibacter michiganensis]|uniref:DHA2 family efflux MFS transporter permease subunit n=1 Tax=Clavibacter michiganensis TaxID=28447 RepID=UPI003EB8F863